MSKRQQRAARIGHVEDYFVRINYLNENNVWVYGEGLTVQVKICTGMKEKCNHKSAEKMVRNMYPTCMVLSVTYC